MFDCEWRCCRFQTTRCHVLALFQITTVMYVPTYSFTDPRPLQELVQKATVAENYSALKKVNIYHIKIPAIPKAQVEFKRKIHPTPTQNFPNNHPKQTCLFTRINTNNKAHVQSVQSSVFPGQICSILVNILHRNRLFSSSFFVWKYFLSFLFFSPPFFVFRVLPLAPSQPVQILLTRIDLVAAAWLLQKEKLLFSISLSLSLSHSPSLSLTLPPLSLSLSSLPFLCFA